MPPPQAGQLTTFLHMKPLMNAGFLTRDDAHLTGAGAAQPNGPRCGHRAALFVLVGTNLQFRGVCIPPLARSPFRSPLGYVQLPFLGFSTSSSRSPS